MNIFKEIGLIGGLVCLLVSANSIAATTTKEPRLSMPKTLYGMQLAHDTGYGHYHGSQRRTRSSGRIRSYHYCNTRVFAPCRRNGGSYRYCNRQHHLCTYGHLQNCIKGKTC